MTLTGGITAVVHLSAFDDQTLLDGINTPGLYKLEATIGSCVFTQEIEVVDHGLPTVSLSGKEQLCPGETVNIVVDNYHSDEGASFAYLYWDNNETEQYSDWLTAQLSLNDPATYSVTVVDEYGCKASDNIIIESVESQSLNLGDPVKICTNDKVLLENPVASALAYQWYRVNAGFGGFIGK